MAFLWFVLFDLKTALSRNQLHAAYLLFPPSERQEKQILRAVSTGPSSVRLNWRLIRAARGYRLEWKEGEGQMSIHHCGSKFSFLLWP